LGGLGYELNALDRWQGETLRLHADGHAYPQWEIVTPVQDEKGGISHYVIFFEDISERKAAERRIQDLAFYDELTGLPNRRQLHETLTQAFTDANRSHLIGALLFIDLDHFKTINDSLGHATGDWLLKEVASRLKRLVRQGDCLARLGGDEFVLLLPALSISPPQAEMQADLIAERLIGEIAAPMISEARCCTSAPVSASPSFPVGSRRRGICSSRLTPPCIRRNRRAARPGASSMPPCSCRPTGVCTFTTSCAVPSTMGS
jgi:diguanylate cyclase (GGDEF)-like protein